MFKAQRKNGKGDVRGWLNITIDNRCFIVEKCHVDGDKYEQPIVHYCENEVIPSTLSMKTWQPDKHGEMIYGSFKLPDGTMTEGGDDVYVLVSRVNPYYQVESKHDGDYKVRAKVVFNRGKWELDFDNAENREILKLKGKEREERRFHYQYDLCDYDNKWHYGYIEIIKGE